MRRIFLLFLVISACKGYAQDPGSIIGKWLKTPKEDLIIEVYKSEDEYKGKISWIKDTASGKQIGFQNREEFIRPPQKSERMERWKSSLIRE